MQLKYQKIHGKSCIVLYVDDTDEYCSMYNKIYTFNAQHRCHVLREYYRECKEADVWIYQPVEEDFQNKVFPIMIFRSEWEQHAPYIAILQKELGLVIEDLPT